MLLAKILGAAAILACVAWAWWSCMAAGELRKRRQREKENYTFAFAKEHDAGGRWLGDEITGFLQDYPMGEDAFKRTFVEIPVRAAMDDYRKAHRPESKE